MNITGMAWRNVWRNPRRTTVTVSAMGLALLFATLYSGIVRGYLIGMEANILDRELGDIQVFPTGYRDDPSLHSLIADSEALLARLDAAGFRSSARLLGAGLAAAGDSSGGVSLRGVNVARDATVGKVHEALLAGSWLDPDDPSSVVLGKRLAKTLAVEPGAEIVLLTQGADGSLANDLYKVRGVLRSVGDAVDRTGVFMTEAAFRELLVVPHGAHQIIVRRPDGLPLPDATAAVRALSSGHEVKSWKELMPTMASMLESTQGVMYAMFLIIYVVIGIVLLNAMLMAVFERIRELGVLKALGVRPGQVLRLVYVESVVQLGLAVVGASVLSVPGLYYLSTVGLDLASMSGVTISGIAWDSVLKADTDVATFAGPLVTLVLVVVVAVLYPALKAARIRPVEAMHHR